MARMHNSTKGKSGSTRPNIDSLPEWAEREEGKVEDLVVQLAKQGYTASEIGVQLRDQYGIPDVQMATDKSVTDIIEENDLTPEFPDDLMALLEKAVNLNKHLKRNHKDVSNKRGLQLVESKIRRLVKYYKKQGKLPDDWKYSIDKAEMLTQ
ncbi:MAG: 30S ribosomal protein S15 [Thermoplasmata archaeon]